MICNVDPLDTPFFRPSPAPILNAEDFNAMLEDIFSYKHPRPDTYHMSIDGVFCEGPWPDREKYELDLSKNWSIPHFVSKK